MGGIVLAEFAVLQSIGATWAPVVLPAIGSTLARNAVSSIACDVLDVRNRVKQCWKSFWGGNDGDGEEDGHNHIDEISI